MRKHRFTMSCLCAASLLMAGCTGKQAETKAPPRPVAPVVVATAAERDIPVQIKAIGNVEAMSTSAVRSQVNGLITQVHFREGQDVRKGQLLFEIDPRTYEATLAQAQANLGKAEAALSQSRAQLARDQAQAKLSADQATRYENLARQGIVSRDQNEQFHTTAQAQDEAVKASRAAVESAKANVMAAEAAVQDARLQLSFTRIPAPISGTTGSLTVRTGNLVKANDLGTPSLVSINQISPIYVSFAIPEQYLNEVKQRLGGKLEVQATPAQGGATTTGTLTFLENAVDTATGTIRARATFSNNTRQLWPGEFVNVVLTVGSISKAVVVPSQAVQVGQKGSYVFVVKDDNTAEARTVESNRQFENLAVIQTGLRPGERVVTDGQLKVTPGGKVQILKQPVSSAVVNSGMPGGAP